mmetsp:Transcript_2927/g.8340  ORF Transcript_2927/g.8340 Transcript_2927/m.8340 type:complete len:207 (+) Transcript_2927:441-1061(+)
MLSAVAADSAIVLHPHRAVRVQVALARMLHRDLGHPRGAPSGRTARDPRRLRIPLPGLQFLPLRHHVVVAAQVPSSLAHLPGRGDAGGQHVALGLEVPAALAVSPVADDAIVLRLWRASVALFPQLAEVVAGGNVLLAGPRVEGAPALGRGVLPGVHQGAILLLLPERARDRSDDAYGSSPAEGWLLLRHLALHVDDPTHDVLRLA